jgi:hypothetical protein
MAVAGFVLLIGSYFSKPVMHNPAYIALAKVFYRNVFGSGSVKF